MNVVRLLTDAARAYGYGDKRVNETGVVVMEAGYDAAPLMWNPLTNDAAAFRLACKLELTINTQGTTNVSAYKLDDPQTPLFAVRVDDDRAAAVRKAIVDCAAYIGEQMTENCDAS